MELDNVSTVKQGAATLSSPGELRMPAMLATLGIRSISFSEPANYADVVTRVKIVTDHSYNGHAAWLVFKKQFSLEKAQAYLQWAQTVLFREWTTVPNAHGLWEGLLREVISSLEGRNREYIFLLGNPISKTLFELDEILQIISNFSLYGRVSLVVDEHEAIGLWKVLMRRPLSFFQSVQQLLFPRKCYRSVFQKLRVDQLLICLADSILVIRETQELELMGVKMEDREAAILEATSM